MKNEEQNLNEPQNSALNITDVRRSISWSQKEVDMLMNYEEADDSETLDERLDFARYMLHYESGFDFPSRSLQAVRKKFYEVCKKMRSGD